MPLTPLSFTLNARQVSADVAPGARLSEVLREAFGARDVKVGCNAGDCGACTVLLNGEPVCACLTSAAQAAGSSLETLAGLAAADDTALALAGSFQSHGAAQCGICTPGIMVSAVALLREEPNPDERQVMDALGGVLCRCTGYRKILDAVLTAGQAQPVARTDKDRAVGVAIPRIDGAAKVNGSELYGDDVAPADALTVRVVRSPYHHAAFTFGDLAAYRAATPGLELILTAAEVPGVNLFGVMPGFEDQPAFAESVARFRGEAVAAVVGETAAILALDLDTFPITWEERQPCLTVAEAEQETAVELHEGREKNLMCGGFVQRGDAAAGLAAADAVVEATFETGFVEHAYIEPEAGFARRVGDRIEIHACTQAPHLDRDSLAKLLGLAPEQVRILPTAVGGGFGSKLDLSLQPYVALAAWMTDRPARITYSRTESMQSTTKRHPAEMRVRIGATKDGRISGFDFDGAFNTGAYSSWGPTVANRVPVHASGPYHIENYRARSRGVHTHCAPSGAFRGFGVPQAAMAQEVLFDELADALGLDRLEFRRRNQLDNGLPTVTGQVFERGVGISACFDALEGEWQRAKAEAAAWNANNDGLRRGVGLAAGWYGCGNTSIPNPSTIKAGLRADGKPVLHQGAMDIGQGANTVIAQIFAQALGVPVEGLELVGGDTDITPDAGKTSASRQTYVSGNAARLTGEALRAEILRLGNVSQEATILFEPEAIRLLDGGRGAAHRSVQPGARSGGLRAARRGEL